MGSELTEPSAPAKLPILFFSATVARRDDDDDDGQLPSGMLTPPLHTAASVPFRWEEEPGKPRPCTTLITQPPPPLTLDLPPRLLLLDSPTATSTKTTKTPSSSSQSPTTVLDGPDQWGKSVFSSSSFRLFGRDRYERRRQGSFDSSPDIPPEAEQEQLLLGKLVALEEKGSRGLFGSFRKAKNNKDEDKKGERNGKRMKRNGSFSSLSHLTRSHFWATIYEGFKHVVPWKNKKTKKGGFTT